METKLTERHPFFAILAHAGIRQRRVCEVMSDATWEVTEQGFTNVKNGRRELDWAFASRATLALEELGLRHPEGRAYRVDELFSMPVMVRTVTGDEGSVTEVSDEPAALAG